MILATKLFVPRARRESVARPRLFDRLNAALAGKLVLVSAPAGFGKTTLVTDWLANSPRFAAPVRPHYGQSATPTAPADPTRFVVTWLALDDGDNDPVRFFGYLVAALQKVAPELGNTAQQMLLAPQPPALDNLMLALVNEMALSDTAIAPAIAPAIALVLDDYHTITDMAIHQAMIFFIEHLPPQMRIIIISRVDPPLPLARWRVRRDVTEVRATDLRFTQGEVASFLHQAMGRTLGAADVAALEERTEGWIAGLQLAALSMSERDDLEQFIRSFTGSHALVVDYLSEEVLHRQPPDVQEFLFATAVLDRFCGPLCDAVRLAPAGDSQRYLERLERAHLFLVPLDDERGWFRYHHLFADLLRVRLLQTHSHLIPQLHARASQWFGEHGWPLDAVRHALAGHDFGRAAGMIETHAQLLLNRGETITLLQWLDRLPAAEIRRRPRLALVQAMVAMRAHRLPEAESHLQEAEEAARQIATEGATALASELAGEILAIRANIALNSNRLADAITLGEEALAALPVPQLTGLRLEPAGGQSVEQRRLRAEVMMHLGLSLLWSGHFERAATYFGDAARQSEAAGDLYTALLAHANYGTLFYMQGHLRRAVAKFRQSLDLAEQRGAPQMPITAVAYQPLAELYYEWNDLAVAAEFAVQAVERSLRGGNPRILLLCYAVQGRIQLAQGQVDAARATIGLARRLVEERNLPRRYANEVNTLEIKSWLRYGDVARAVEWVTRQDLNDVDTELTGKEGQYRLLARVLLAQGEATRALILARRLAESAQRAGKVLSIIETLALTSVIELALADERAALATLQAALALAEPEGYVRLFLDEGVLMGQLLHLLAHEYTRTPPESAPLAAYAARLLAAWRAGDAEAVADNDLATEELPLAVAAQTPHAQSLIEPLSERELEVLRLVAAGLSDRQVAEKLVIVPGTVKRHLNNLYSKLGVHSRTQALVRARELALIERGA